MNKGVFIFFINWMMRTTYIVQCADDSLYTGITTNIERRIHEHNHSHLGAKYTQSRRPVHLVWYQCCNSRSSASKLEYRIKQLNREEKINLIQTKITL